MRSFAPGGSVPNGDASSIVTWIHSCCFVAHRSGCLERSLTCDWAHFSCFRTTTRLNHAIAQYDDAEPRDPYAKDLENQFTLGHNLLRTNNKGLSLSRCRRCRAPKVIILDYASRRRWFGNGPWSTPTSRASNSEQALILDVTSVLTLRLLRRGLQYRHHPCARTAPRIGLATGH